MNVCLSTFTCTKSVKFYFYVLVIKIPYVLRYSNELTKIWYISQLLKVEEKLQLWMQAIEQRGFFVLLLRNLSANII